MGDLFVKRNAKFEPCVTGIATSYRKIITDTPKQFLSREETWPHQPHVQISYICLENNSGYISLFRSEKHSFFYRSKCHNTLPNWKLQKLDMRIVPLDDSFQLTPKLYL